MTTLMRVTTLDKVPDKGIFAMEYGDGYALYIAGKITENSRKCQRLTKKYDIIFPNIDSKKVILPPRKPVERGVG
jgi:hypothetical protein